MDIEKRIAQFEKIVAEDPGNDMAHFSLAAAYNQAGRYAEAAASYERCIDANADMSKAYQMAGAAWHAAGQDDKAAAVLTRGYAVAARRGDLMPKKGMADLLTKLGVAIPEVAEDKKEAAPAGDFRCTRTGKLGTRLPRPPFRNALGQWIHENISKQTFDEWIGLGTKIINELRLDLSRDEHELVYDFAMRRFLGVDDALYERLMGRTPGTPTAEYTGVIEQILGRSGQLESFQGELHKTVK
jgi:Fe-S cluster biosynthesis and repair protein YggX